MKSLLLFWSFFKISLDEVRSDFKLYLSSFIFLLVLSNLPTFFSFLGIKEDSTLEISLIIIIQIFISIVIAKIILIQKRDGKSKNDLLFLAPTFLLNNLYYSFIALIGFIFLVIPGLLAYIYFSFAPFIAILDDSSSENYFISSKKLVSKNVSLVSWCVFILLFFEMISFVPEIFPDFSGKAIVALLFSFPDSFLSIVLTVTTVKIYYFLRDFSDLDRSAHNNTQVSPSVS